MRRLFSVFLAFALTLTVAACDSAEERAEQHYQDALALIADGDVDRAIVELRNVFRLVPNHLEARHEMARAYLEGKDNPQEAYSQYLRIVEQYPDDLKARIELSQLAFLTSNWEELDRHGAVAREAAPEDVRVRIIALGMDYREAVEDQDTAVRNELVAQAKSLRADDASNQILTEVVLDDHLRNQDLTAAMTLLDSLTTNYPENRRYWMQRLQVLLAIGNQADVEKQLIDLVDLFPEDGEHKKMLVRYYLSRDELGKTEDFLRKLAEESTGDDPSARVDLIRFLMERVSVEAALAETEAAIETVADPEVFIMLKSGLNFSMGNEDLAIRELEAAIEESAESERVNEMKVSLAKMLLGTGNEVGARAQVEQVLADDPAQAEALKINAAWLIEADDTDGAIAALRTALESNDDDSAAMSLMASAYLRAGSTDLARDFMSLAVEASGNAPEETVRYVEFLISEERYLPAEDVLLPALRLAPGNVDLLRMTGQLYLAMEDFGRLQQVIDTLANVGTEPAKRIAVQLEATLLNQSEGTEEALEYLDEVAEASEGDIQTRILLLRGRVAAGDFDAAIALAEEMVNEAPDAPALNAVLASVLATSGDLERSLETYLDLAEKFPDEQNYRVEIASLQNRLGNPEAARQTVLEGLAVAPDNPRLLWAHAYTLERDGDIDGAIDVYETLYEQNSNNLVVANNLASLIATYRDDAESLDRAWTIARRFRGSDVPHIQDTYGWIIHRRGESEDALPYLETAAATLEDDPIVQFHYAEVLFATDKLELALAQYRETLNIAGVGDSRPQISTAQDRIVEIEARLAQSQ